MSLAPGLPSGLGLRVERRDIPIRRRVCPSKSLQLGNPVVLGAGGRLVVSLENREEPFRIGRLRIERSKLSDVSAPRFELLGGGLLSFDGGPM